jgi:hypothetical protein
LPLVQQNVVVAHRVPHPQVWQKDDAAVQFLQPTMPLALFAPQQRQQQQELVLQ